MRFRRMLTITSRTSSITNGFVQAIIPSIEPTIEQTEAALRVLGMTRATICCAYCGGAATDWDHLRPLVKNKRPTGYISEYRNLVPSCGRCNQSKSGADWRVWMEGSAPGSPRARGIRNVEERIKRLGKFERWGRVEPLDLQALAPAKDWRAHWQNLAEVVELMVRSQAHAAALRVRISKAFQDRVQSNRTRRRR